MQPQIYPIQIIVFNTSHELLQLARHNRREETMGRRPSDDLLDSTKDCIQWRKVVAEASVCAHNGLMMPMMMLTG